MAMECSTGKFNHSMSYVHGTSLLTTPGHFGPVLLPYVSNNDDEEYCYLK